MKKTVLITGAAGFIGSHLCDFFLSKNYKVIGIDNLITGNLKNLSHLNLNMDFQFKKIDITHGFGVVEILQVAFVDGIKISRYDDGFWFHELNLINSMQGFALVGPKKNSRPFH